MNNTIERFLILAAILASSGANGFLVTKGKISRKGLEGLLRLENIFSAFRLTSKILEKMVSSNTKIY